MRKAGAARRLRPFARKEVRAVRLCCDLHIHSCLSPCAEDDMTPATIAGLAKLAGAEDVYKRQLLYILGVPPLLSAHRADGVFGHRLAADEMFGHHAARLVRGHLHIGHLDVYKRQVSTCPAQYCLICSSGGVWYTRLPF